MFQSCTKNPSEYKYKYEFHMSNGTAICDLGENICGHMMCQCDTKFLDKIKAVTLKPGCPTVDPGCWSKCNIKTIYVLA